MSKNYSPALPLGQHGEVKTSYPPPKAVLQTTHATNTSASSVLVFTHNTTEIEVAATGGPIAGKWANIANNGTSVIAAAGTANFDFVVPAASVRRFVVPIQTYNSNVSSVQGVNRREGLYQGVAYIQAGPVASVLTMEF